MPQTLTAAVYARPRKIAFLVGVDDDPELRRWLVDYNCVIWGGLLNAIVPTDGKSLESQWWAFLEWHDPDVIINCVDLDDHLIDELDQRLLPFDIMERGGVGSIVPNEIDSLFESQNLTQMMLLYHVQDTRKTAPGSSSFSVLELAEQTFGFDYLHAYYGRALLQEHQRSLREVHAQRIEMECSCTGHLRNCLSYERSGHWRSPLEQTLMALRDTVDYSISFGPLAPSQGDVFPLEIVVSSQPNMRDFCGFWNLRTAWMDRSHVVWLPEDALVSDPAAAAAWLSSQAKSIDRGNVVGVNSLSLCPDRVDEVAALLTEASQGAIEVRPGTDELGRCFPRGCMLWNRREARDVIVSGDAVTIYPLSPDFVPPLAGKHLGRWVNEIHLDSASEKAGGWRLPKLTSLAVKTLVPDMNGHSYDIRTSRVTKQGTIVVSVGTRANAFPLHLPDRRELLGALLGPQPVLPRIRHRVLEEKPPRPGVCADWELTDKGICVDAVVHLAGNLEAAAHLWRQFYVRAAIDKLSGCRPREERPTPLRWKHILDVTDPPNKEEIIKLVEEIEKLTPLHEVITGIDWYHLIAEIDWHQFDNHQPILQWLTMVLRRQMLSEGANWLNIFRDSGLLSSRGRKVLHKELEELVKKGIIFQGLCLKCPYCGSEEWYPLESIGATFQCEGCLETHGVPANPEWRFRLNPAVANAAVNNQDVTLLTLYLLQSEVEHSFLWCPEIKIYKDEDHEKAEDIDFIAVADGQLMIGECTRSPSFADADIGKMKSLARELHARWIVFATTAEKISPDSWNRILPLIEELGEEGIQVDALEGRDLHNGRRGKKQRAISQELSKRRWQRQDSGH